MFRIDNEKFGAFVSQLRREKGMTQKELAARLFISDKAVSKWERGMSLPDISLLQPLADLLNVSVTELLSGQYIQDDAQPAKQEVEEILLSTVATLTAQEQEAQRQNRRRWGCIYAACLLCGVLETFLLWHRLFDAIVVFMILPPLLAALFGIHFCFFATEKLPDFYDRYRIHFYSEGAFRMDVPGVHFNNSNWPHILHGLRVWCAVMLALWIPAYALVHEAAGVLFSQYMKMFVLFLLFFPVFFGGLFGPVYVLGRKYE